MAPVRTFQVRVKYAAWLTEDTKELIKKETQLRPQQPRPRILMIGGCTRISGTQLIKKKVRKENLGTEKA